MDIVPMFFVSIDNPSTDLRKIAFPEGFNNVFGRLQQAHLIAPHGLEQRVKVRKKNGKVWISSGWERFAALYSIELGYMIIFKYLGKTHFRVTIYDGSDGMEIKYPIFDGPDEISMNRESSDQEEEETTSAQTSI